MSIRVVRVLSLFEVEVSVLYVVCSGADTTGLQGFSTRERPILEQIPSILDIEEVHT